MRKLLIMGVVAALLVSCLPIQEVSATTVEETTIQKTEGEKPPKPEGERPPRPEDGEKPPKPEGENKDAGSKYSIEQAISDNAQLNTIAFSGLAFLTGTEGADSFFPPGKVADFFGFQYMRDIDIAGYGHNTTFLSKAAANVLYILNEDQLEILKSLALEQADMYESYGYGRLVMIDAFRKVLEENEVLDISSVEDYSAELYEIDGQLSYHRAEALGEIIRSFTEEQKSYLEKMSFDDSSTWPDIDENQVLDKKSMSHMEHVAVMTYASELFSWYKGSIEADIYFCPERHGTYFGGFYMKDYPAMGNPDYFISTTITGNSGKEFLNTLTEEQRVHITSIIEEQRDDLNRIVDIRTEVSGMLRIFMVESTVDEEEVMTLMKEYGELEGRMSALYAERFAAVEETLTDEQKESLMTLRNQYIFPEGAYLYSQPIKAQNADGTDLLK